MDVAAFISDFDTKTQGSKHLFPAHLTLLQANGESVLFPRYLFVGPRAAGGCFLRAGLFAGIHGDEEAGILATLALLEQWAQNPDAVTGYEVFAYPVCNPTGYAAGSRWSKTGSDLNREFWRFSLEPEVILLEAQLRKLQFDGIIALHSDDTSEGIYGFVNGNSLTRHVLEPALQAAAAILPRNFDRQIDSFEAKEGVIEEGYPGVLGAPPEQKPKPFEIVFETPHDAPLDEQVNAHCTAVQVILERFRALISEAQNI